MTETATPLTLDALAEQLALLRSEVEELRQENARLRFDRSMPDDRVGISAIGHAHTSRRQVLGTGIKLAAGALGAGVMLARQPEPASADADHTSTHFSESNGLWAIHAQSTSGDAGGIYATSESDNFAAVQGVSTAHGPGVLGKGLGTGVPGTGGSGVEGQSFGPHAIGVFGRALSGGFGVSGETNSPATPYTLDARAGVRGRNFGTGAGVIGQSEHDNGDGVWGMGNVGVRATSYGGNGYGAVIEGGKAQLRLKPLNTAGKPTTGAHLKGELILDFYATLWLCTKGGTPGTWRKVSTTAT